MNLQAIEALGHIRKRVADLESIPLPTEHLLRIVQESAEEGPRRSFMRCQLAMVFFRLAIRRADASVRSLLVPVLARPTRFPESLRAELLRAFALCVQAGVTVPTTTDLPTSGSVVDQCLVASLLAGAMLLVPQLHPDDHQRTMKRSSAFEMAAQIATGLLKEQHQQVVDREMARREEWASLRGLSPAVGRWLLGAAGHAVASQAATCDLKQLASQHHEVPLFLDATPWGLPESIADPLQAARGVVAAVLSSERVTRLQLQALRFAASGFLPSPLAALVAVLGTGAPHHSVVEQSKSILSRAGGRGLDGPWARILRSSDSAVADEAQQLVTSVASSFGADALSDLRVDEWAAFNPWSRVTLSDALYEAASQECSARDAVLHLWATRQLFVAVLGTRSSMEGLNPSLRRRPCHPMLQSAILEQLSRSEVGAFCVADVQQCVLQCLLGAKAPAPLRRAAVALCGWTLRVTPEHRVKPFAPLLVRALLGLFQLADKTSPPESTQLVDAAYALLPQAAWIARDSLSQSPMIAELSLARLEKEVGDRKLSASQCASAIARVYNGAPAHVLHTLTETLLAHARSEDYTMRQSALQWAIRALPPLDVRGRCIALTLAGDTRGEIRSAALKALGPSILGHSFEGSRSTDGLVDPMSLLLEAVQDPAVAASVGTSKAVTSSSWWIMYDASKDPFDLARPIPRASADAARTGFPHPLDLIDALVESDTPSGGASKRLKRSGSLWSCPTDSFFAVASLPARCAAVTYLVACTRVFVEALSAPSTATMLTSRPDLQHTGSLNPLQAFSLARKHHPARAAEIDTALVGIASLAWNVLHDPMVTEREQEAMSSALCIVGLASSNLSGELFLPHAKQVTLLASSSIHALRVLGSVLVGCIATILPPVSDSDGESLVSLLSGMLDAALVSTTDERSSHRKLGALLSLGHVIAASSTSIPRSMLGMSASTLLEALSSDDSVVRCASMESLCVMARACPLPLLPHDGEGRPSRQLLVTTLAAIAVLPPTRSRVASSSISHLVASDALDQERQLAVQCLGAIGGRDEDAGVREACAVALLRLAASRMTTVVDIGASALVELCARAEGDCEVLCRALDHCLTVLLPSREPLERTCGIVWSVTLFSAFGSTAAVQQRWSLARVAYLYSLSIAAPDSRAAIAAAQGLALAHDESSAPILSSTDDGEPTVEVEEYLRPRPFLLGAFEVSATANAAVEGFRLHAALEEHAPLNPASLRALLNSIPPGSWLGFVSRLASECGDSLLFFSFIALTNDPPPPPAARTAVEAAVAASAPLRAAPGEVAIGILSHYLRAVAIRRCLVAIDQLVPRLARGLNDPRVDIRRVCQRIWSAITAEPSIVLRDHAVAVMRYCAERATSDADWRGRQAAISTIPDALSACDSESATASLAWLWRSVVAGLCDTVEGVAREAASTAKTLTSFSRRICDPSQVSVKVATDSLDSLLPFLLSEGLDAAYSHARSAALNAIIEVVAASRELCLPWAADVSGAILDALPGLESPEAALLQSHANAGGGTALNVGGLTGAHVEAMRLTAARSSVVWKAIDQFVSLVRSASASELAAPSKGAHSELSSLAALLVVLAQRCVPSRHLMIRGGAATAMRDIVAAAGYSVAPHASFALDVLIRSSSLLDESIPVRRLTTATIAQLCNACPMDTLSHVLDIARVMAGLPPTGPADGAEVMERLAWALSSDADDSTGDAIQELLVRHACDESTEEENESSAALAHSLAGLLAGERQELVRNALLPPAFVGRFHKDGNSRIAQAWHAAWEALVPGTARAAVRNATAAVVFAARCELHSRVWARRRAGARALAAVVQALVPAESSPFLLLDASSGGGWSPLSLSRVLSDSGVAVSVLAGSPVLVSGSDPRASERSISVVEIAGKAVGPLSAVNQCLRGRWWDGKDALFDAGAACLCADAAVADTAGVETYVAEVFRSLTKSATISLAARVAGLRCLSAVLLAGSRLPSGASANVVSAVVSCLESQHSRACKAILATLSSSSLAPEGSSSVSAAAVEDADGPASLQGDEALLATSCLQTLVALSVAHSVEGVNLSRACCSLLGSDLLGPRSVSVPQWPTVAAAAQLIAMHAMLNSERDDAIVHAAGEWMASFVSPTDSYRVSGAMAPAVPLVAQALRAMMDKAPEGWKRCIVELLLRGKPADDVVVSITQ
jgi:hypothetical protein